MSIQLPDKRCSFPPYDPHSFLLTPISSSSLTNLSASLGLIIGEFKILIFSSKSMISLCPGLLPIYPHAATKLPSLDSGLGIPTLRMPTFSLTLCLSPVFTAPEIPPLRAHFRMHRTYWPTRLPPYPPLAHRCLIRLILLSP